MQHSGCLNYSYNNRQFLYAYFCFRLEIVLSHSQAMWPMSTCCCRSLGRLDFHSHPGQLQRSIRDVLGSLQIEGYSRYFKNAKSGKNNLEYHVSHHTIHKMLSIRKTRGPNGNWPPKFLSGSQFQV